jgi:hypothetical protein
MFLQNVGIYLQVHMAEDGDSMFLGNDIYFQVHMALQPRRPTLTSSLLSEPQISYKLGKYENYRFFQKRH